MTNPSPLNVQYWATRYDAGPDDTAVYDEALRTHDDYVSRARALWDWKDLSRGVDFDAVEPVLESLDIRTYLNYDQSEAVQTLGERLVAGGALANRTIVTPAFILHLADSDPDNYSVRFPIFDVRCWVAYVFLSGRRTGTDSLPASATTSSKKYGEFCSFFERTKPDQVPGRVYETAIFSFGAYISRLSVETVVGIHDHLAKLEDAVSESTARHSYGLVDLSTSQHTE